MKYAAQIAAALLAMQAPSIISAAPVDPPSTTVEAVPRQLPTWDTVRPATLQHNPGSDAIPTDIGLSPNNFNPAADVYQAKKSRRDDGTGDGSAPKLINCMMHGASDLLTCDIAGAPQQQKVKRVYVSSSLDPCKLYGEESQACKISRIAQ